MNNFNIVSILGTGLAGFGFLLMYLAYKLIRSLVTAANVNPLVVSTINRYMLVCFIMTLAVGFSAYMTAYYKKDTIAKQDEVISKKDSAVNLLTTSQKNNAMAEQVVQLTDSTSISAAKKEQLKTLDTLSGYVAAQDNPQLQKEFNDNKNKLISVYDSLKMPELSKPKRDSLKLRYIRINNSIGDISLKVAKQTAAVTNQ